MFSVFDYVWRHTLWTRTWVWVTFWLFVQFICYAYYGTKVLVDTQRFVDEAAAWRSGMIEGSYHFWYSGYILFLCLFPNPVALANWVVFLQMVLALAAFIALLSLVDFKNNNRVKCLLLLYLMYLPYHQWNVCLLTESLFCSALIFFLYFWVHRKRRFHRLALVGSLLSVCLLRPNGFLLILALAIYMIWQYRYNLSKGVWLSGAIGMLGLIILINNYTDVFYLFISNSLATGDYICGYPSSLQIPSNIIHDINTKYSGTLIKLIVLFVEQPGTILTLMFLKVAYLLAEVRPYYNGYHNLFSAISMVLLYTALFWNLRKLQEAQVLAMIFIVLNILMVAITYCDWDGRFFAALFPYLLYMSCPQKQETATFSNVKQPVLCH